MTITIPEFCLVALIGASGSGKTTFAHTHFLPTEVVSSDACRGAISDHEDATDISQDAFKLVREIAGMRLARRKLVVIDATSVLGEDRAHLLRLAKAHHARAVAIVLDPGQDVCIERDIARPGRTVGAGVIGEQMRALKQGVSDLAGEGFHEVFTLGSPAEIGAAEIAREKLLPDRRELNGAFDIIGDVHGCRDELLALLEKLGYQVRLDGEGAERAVVSSVPVGRRAIFVGDLVDRGPASPDVLRIAMHMVAEGQALCVPGNHDVKLLRYLEGRDVKLNHGLDATVTQLASEPPEFKAAVQAFIDGLVSHVWLDGGQLAIAHAGIKDTMIGRIAKGIRLFCLYGETSGETDEFGLPVRYNWAAEYRGATTVIYGHTPVPTAEWLNNTLCIDTGCVFGGKLTALRWPEKEIVSVPAARVYVRPIRPLAHPPPRPGADLSR